LSNPLTIIRAWRSRRKLRLLQEWEQTRTKGKGRFVIRTALYYGFAMVGMMDLFDHVFSSGPQPPISLFKLIYWVCAGFLIAGSAWSNREGEYQKALHEARARALPN